MKAAPIVFLIFTTLSVQSADVAEHPPEISVPQSISGLMSATGSERDRFAKALVADRRAMINALLKIAETDAQPTGGATDVSPYISPKKLAIYLLGEYRAQEAVGYLVRNILYRSGGGVKLDPADHGYPCELPLVFIGEPAVDGILKRLNEPAQDEELEVFTRIITYVYPAELGLCHLEAAMDKAEKSAKPNFRKLIGLFKKRNHL